MKVAALILAGGHSRRLGQPKQLLDLGGRPLLQYAVDTARSTDGIDQVVLALGHAADDIRAAVDTTGCRVVVTDRSAGGCSGSITAGMADVDADTDGVVLLPGDQPGLRADTITTVLAAVDPSVPIAVTRYDDAIGHPFWFGASLFDDLRGLGGDKAAWKLVASERWPVVEVPIAGPIPPDVDTWDDYEAVQAGMAS